MTDLLVCPQCGFDLTKLNAMPPNLDLVIGPT
jgi:hypothetical protein